jgi:hypothetical protein
MAKRLKGLWILFSNTFEPMRIFEEKMLKENERKNKNIFVMIFRYFGYNLALKLKNTRIAPNQVSVIAFIFGILSALSFSMGTYLYIILGALLCQLSEIFDYCDGSLARLKGMSSSLGEWLEWHFNPLRGFLINFGICWGLYKQTSNIGVWILGFVLCGIGYMLTIQARLLKSLPLVK